MRTNILLHPVQVDVSEVTQPAFTCSKLTTETLEQGVKLTPSSTLCIVNFEQVNAGWECTLNYTMTTKVRRHWHQVVYLLLTFKDFHTLF